MIVKILRELFAFFLVEVCYNGKKERDDIISIYFHNPSEKVFENVLKWLIIKNYKFISTNELHFFIANKAKPPGRFVCITFDDGWNNNLMLVYLIEKYKVPITIFVTTEAIIEGNFWFEYASQKGQEYYTQISKKEDFKKLSSNEFYEKVKILKLNFSLKRSCFTLNELKKLTDCSLITIGSHTLTHPILNKCSMEEQVEELAQSKKILSNWLFKNIEYIAYPNGDFNQDTLEISKISGYKLGFSTEIGKIDINKVNPFIVPRNAIHDTGGYYENISKALGIWQNVYYKNRFILFRVKPSNKPD